MLSRGCVLSKWPHILRPHWNSAKEAARVALCSHRRKAELSQSRRRSQHGLLDWGGNPYPHDISQ
ncbi:hypothetical protein BD309DRAFT_973169 [Dichomitus squalens]|uniref:Uncharacterized protein n=1 Tax=Dichomitus squalens TaxID=114155 RepID=A0A4Q9NAG0_9APHY|nr:hypothetical protein BD309DRAFT_973169 [Dichomitus squalens]TBU59500.1 hypothetical protein BD310DRAFT_924818 [Dichomitus squalens]